jgi:hypothetical protein
MIWTILIGGYVIFIGLVVMFMMGAHMIDGEDE